MFRRCTMSSLLKEVRAALQPQIPDVAGSLLRRLLVGSLRAGESHPGRNLDRLDLQAYDVAAVCLPVWQCNWVLEGHYMGWI